VICRWFSITDEEISYLLADPVTRYAAVLDPHSQAELDYLKVIRKLDLRLVYLIETHAHESHLSAAPVLRAATGARLIIRKQVAATYGNSWMKSSLVANKRCEILN